MNEPRRILVVEDSEDDAELVVRLLRRAGLELIHLRVETRDAMAAALEAERWDLVIADYSMPHFDGLAALKLLRSKAPDCPFILISGSVGEEVAVQAMQAGANDYVLKSNLTRLQHAVERELREAEVRRDGRMAEERYRSLFNRVPVGVFGTTLQGDILEANPAFVEMLGLTDVDELKRGNICDFWARPEDRKQLVELMERDGIARNFETQFRRRDGSLIWCAENASAMHDHGGRFNRYEAVVVDITERRRVEEEISRARDQALETARLRSEFLTRMSHEIRTPLSAIIGTTELQLLSQDLSAEQRRRTEIVQSGGELLLSIVDDILDFSKLSAGKLALEKFDFNFVELVEGVTDTFAATVRAKGIELALYLDPSIPAGLRADPNRLRQVLNNLISNAIKFTPEGEVLIRVTRGEDTATDVLARFEIKDTGIGIAPEVRKKLFQPFVQAEESTSRRFGGTGLGLVITAQLVERMGGRIEVDSTQGQGSTFYFALRFEKGEPIVHPWTAEAAAARFNRMRVLIVDDSAVSRSVLADYLRAWRIENVAVRNGPAALQELRAAADREARYNAILLDEGLPGTSGLSLARVIRHEPRIADAKIVIMSSDIGSEDSVAKVESWLTKPVLPSRLFECLDNLLLNNEVEQAVARVTAPVENLQEEWRRQVRVLVVEDNLTNQTLVREQLSLLGYTVHVVDDAQHALEALAHDRYDVVLMDCELPGMDGYAATAEIRRREGDKHHTVVVALTAHATEGQRERCLEAGMNGYLSKPVKLQILGETIDGWTRRDGKSDESGPTESHGQPELEELDPATLADLAQLSAATGHNMFRNLVDDFLWDLSGRVVSIKDALDANDLPRLATQVHPLKSASAIIGAKHFAIVCSDVEENARAGKADRAVPLARELLAAAQRLPAVLKRVAAQS